jgi:hypothetical protein
MLKRLCRFILITFLLAACSNGGSAPTGSPSAPSTGGAGDPVKVVEQYLQAKVATDATTIRQLLCSTMEKDVEQEATTFLGTSGTQIEGLSCQFDGVSKVACQGKIVADYGQEKNEFPLVSYKVVQEDGEWKYCGETQ